jgi:anaerobic dimethyl sulfoxide reductase subunit A
MGDATQGGVISRTKGGMSRRAFVGASTVAALALAAGCSPENKLGETDDRKVYRLDAELDESVDGKWVPVSCWFSCGGGCANYAYVVDNVVVRQKTDDWNADDMSTVQQRACVRGRSLRQMVYNDNRIKYPMKRKNWQPGGDENSNGQLRGIDEWERISWDEAFDLISSETKRIYDTYGPRSVFTHDGSGAALNKKIMGSLGGYVGVTTTGSFGTILFASLCLGLPMWDVGNTNDRLDLANADLIILYGANSVWSGSGGPAYHFSNARKTGVEFAYVGPEYNVTANLLEARWVPVRPGTDTAFLLSVAYLMITEDDPTSNPIIDWDFLDRCTIGFDADHMPADATVNENFRSYVLGEYDGVPKTPEWATEICGTPVEDIEWYAEKMAVANKTMILHSEAPSRCTGSENFAQLFMTIGAMGGHIGKSGHACGGGAFSDGGGNNGPGLIKNGTMRSGEALAAIINLVDDAIPSVHLWQAIIDGSYNYVGLVSDYARNSGQAFFVPPEKREIDIRMMWYEYGNFFTTNPGTKIAVEAFRKVDFVLVHAIAFNALAQHADIVLPIATQWERGTAVVGFGVGTKNREMTRFPQWAIEPIYEAKSDQDIIYGIGKKLGLDVDSWFPYDPAQQRFDAVANATVLEDDGATWSPLATITQDDIDELGFDNPPQEGKVPVKELLEKGLYVASRREGDNFGHIAHAAFREDPIANPIATTVSGKLEIYCQAKADILNASGIASVPFKPYATYRTPVNGYEQSFSDWAEKTKGEYPLQIVTPHYLRRAHTAFEDIKWLREAYANPVYMNSQDAGERGISDGDVVLISSKVGKVTRKATVLDTLMLGVVSLPHGSWAEIDPETGIDHGGSENIVCVPAQSDTIVDGYNTNLVQIEKYSDQSLLSDADRPLVLPKGMEEEN